ncbi:MAG: ABC transporter ATP-binding protein [Clostridia bacterium]|nr:ABC transporter ATP-binding protein [Clostridia bacterium]
MSSLKLTSVNKIYPSGVPALTDINLEVDDNEFIVVVGQEKSGKSTLIRLISGLDDTSSGTVEINGKDVTGLEPKARDVAVVFKGDTLFPGDTIFDNLAFGLKVRKAPQTLIEERVRVVAEILGITDLLYKKPKNLVSSEKLKVAFGRALVREPQLFMFDEPLSGLDSKLRADMLNIIINLQIRTKAPYIYATRNLQDALAIGTRLVILREGFIQQADTPANLYDYPANTYVAFYIGQPTINLIFNANLVSAEDGGVAVKCDFGSIPVSGKIKARIENLEEYLDKDRKVILGIRPEDTQIVEEGGFFTATAVQNSYAGNAIYTECTAGRSNLNVKFREVGENWSGDWDEGAPFKDHDFQVTTDTEHLYLFDGETRLTILAKDEGYEKTSHKDADRMPKSFIEEREILKQLAPQKKKKK